MEEEWRNLDHLTIHDNPKITYYIVARDTILSRFTGPCNVNIGRVIPGMLVKAVGNVNEDALRVQVYCKNKGDIWYQTEWKCHRIDLLSVSGWIWHLLCAVSSLEDRLRLAKNKQFCKDVENIKPNTKVWFCPDSDVSSSNFSTYLANVTYIGAVRELGDGYYFGLDLLVTLIYCCIIFNK